MKKIILCSGLAILTLLQAVSAQDTKVNEKDKTKDKEKGVKEVIIRKLGDKDTKVTVEIKDNEVLINGKPASEYKGDDVKISSRQIHRFGSGNNFLHSPADNIWNDGEKKAFLGVTTEAADGGAKVTNVVEGSAASKAGIKEGDVITTIGDKKVQDPEGVSEAVVAHKPKDAVKIQYQRDGKTSETTATLGENQSFARTFSFNNDGFNKKDGFAEDLLKDLKERRLFEPGTPGVARSFKMYGGGPKLGARIEDTEGDAGAKITKIEEGSAAEKAGLKADDIITEVNGKKVKNIQEVREELMDVKDKSSYNLKAKRGGSEMNFEIKAVKKVNKADI